MSHSVFEIDGTSFTVHKAPLNMNRAISIHKLLIRDRYHVSYVINGTMYSSRVSKGCWYIGNRWQLKDIPLIEEAILLGVLPAKLNLKALKKLKTEEAAQRNREFAAEYFQENAKALGLKLTKAQLAVLDRVERERTNRK